MRNGLLVCLVFMVSACSVLTPNKHIEYNYAKPDSFPTLVAVGYAPISGQPGKTHTEKVINAMKASKMEAYRELAEQIAGQRIAGQQQLVGQHLSQDQVTSRVAGVIRGAEVVKSYAVGEDTYATEMSLDMKRVYELYLGNAPNAIERPSQATSPLYY